MRMIQVLALWSALLIASSLSAGQVAQSFEKEVTATVKIDYLLSLPNGYEADTTKKWPLILFLHGSGERGRDVQQVAKHGPPKLIDSGQDLPFIVVSPLCPELGAWMDPGMLAGLIALLDEIEKTYRVDSSREYLTGLSLGGFGSWALAARYPERFAAVAPLCGRGNPADGPILAKLPIWVFHGADDKAVPLRFSEEMVTAIKKAGGEPKFTIYPDTGHDCWTKTYENPALYDWFLKYSRR